MLPWGSPVGAEGLRPCHKMRALALGCGLLHTGCRGCGIVLLITCTVHITSSHRCFVFAFVLVELDLKRSRFLVKLDR